MSEEYEERIGRTRALEGKSEGKSDPETFGDRLNPLRDPKDIAARNSGFQEAKVGLLRTKAEEKIKAEQHMSDVSLTLNVPASLAREIDLARQEFLLELLERGWRELKIDRALAQYSRGGMSFGAAAAQAGVSQSELARHAYSRGLEPPASDETLDEELGC